MADSLPLTRPYNLARLGQTGDRVDISATADERGAIARWSGVAAVENLSARVEIKKLSPSRFALEVGLTADVVQSCVLTLEPVPAHIERQFRRELHFAGAPRRGLKADPPAAVTLAGPEEDEPPEEIASLQYDLVGPVLEEYVLALDPYPRAQGAEFGLEPLPEDRPESPFGALKNLKSGP